MRWIKWYPRRIVTMSCIYKTKGNSDCSHLVLAKHLSGLFFSDLLLNSKKFSRTQLANFQDGKVESSLIGVIVTLFSGEELSQNGGKFERFRITLKR